MCHQCQVQRRLSTLSQKRVRKKGRKRRKPKMMTSCLVFSEASHERPASIQPATPHGILLLLGPLSYSMAVSEAFGTSLFSTINTYLHQQQTNRCNHTPRQDCEHPSVTVSLRMCIFSSVKPMLIHKLISVVTNTLPRQRKAKERKVSYKTLLFCLAARGRTGVRCFFF